MIMDRRGRSLAREPSWYCCAKHAWPRYRAAIYLQDSLCVITIKRVSARERLIVSPRRKRASTYWRRVTVITVYVKLYLEI